MHVIGAGLAGLAAALSLSEAGRPVTLYESGPAAGGRCRSYFDRELDCRIDNGNHLLLSGNRAAFAYLDQIGARDTLGGPAEAAFPFLDLAGLQRWVVRPNAGRLPWWVLRRDRGVPGVSPRHYLALLALLRAGATATVLPTLAEDALFHRLIEPLAIAALNTPPSEGSARLMAAVMRETLLRGGAACIPAFPRDGLSESFVDPALAWLRGRGATLQLGRRIAGLELQDGRVIALGSPDGRIALAAGEQVVLAVPAPVAAALLPGLTVPDAFEAIVNLHFRSHAAPTDPAVRRAGFLGLVGGTAEWVFVKPGIASVTISAANRLAGQPPEAIAAAVWPEVCAALGLSGTLPAHRVIREKRATFAATPAQDRRRPGPRIGLANLALAGDWTATGLPATIEGAIRSGRVAASSILAGSASPPRAPAWPSGGAVTSDVTTAEKTWAA